MRMVGRVPNAQYPMENKKAAVLELSIRNNSAKEITKRDKVCRPTLYNSKNEPLRPEAPALMKRHHESTPDSNSCLKASPSCSSKSTYLSSTFGACSLSMTC